VLYQDQADPILLDRMAIEDGSDGGGYPKGKDNHADDKGLQPKGGID